MQPSSSAQSATQVQRENLTQPILADGDRPLNQANYLLHRFEPATALFTYIKTTQQKINAASFIDGREDFSVDKTCYQVPAAQTVSSFTATETPLAKFIFHIGFCGSTLLAKTLAYHQAKVLCYKEPQVLIDLAELKATNHLLYRQTARWQQYITFTVQQLAKRFTPEQQLVTKPSNWANSLLPDLAVLIPGSRAVFMSMPKQAYLVAIFRGGKERIAFIYRLRAHLLKVLPDYQPLAVKIDNCGQDILWQVAKSCLLVYRLQHLLFSRAQQLLPSEQWQTLDYQEFLNTPHETLLQVNNTLQLGLTINELELAQAASFQRHAKAPAESYQSHEKTTIDEQVYAYYQDAIEVSLTWDDNLNHELTNACQQIA
ncbi:hypothetical protein [Thalassotalea euphylliae]|uniref:Sulfotransferase family protein n=1 Tax=Thalassotalea euphylliae TaxID=1655234 RepID=A0A3E0U6U5_9GAMM|nr:hypothetical protein [Thalassotalea euphylliae]REL31652.1 hypothetical protein DXX94_13500 [Thalassotalea euphylliae]